MRLVICVSLRIAASAEAPSSPMRLFPILRGTGGGTVRGHMCVSAGADRKANTWELVRAPSGLLQQLQRRVALEALGESGCSLGTEDVISQTARRGVWLVVRSVNAP